jgi:hypothetical protein
MMKIWLIAIGACALAFPSLGVAQSKDRVVGTWKLVSVSSQTDKGNLKKDIFGASSMGFLNYTPEGRVMIFAGDGRKPLSVADIVSAPVEERAQAYSTFVAYAGRYTFTGDKMLHHVEVASLQNDVNTEQVRFAKLEGDRLALRTQPILRDVVLQTFEFVWERLT